MTDRVYIPRRKVAHLTEQGTVTLCGLWWPDGFWGTGSQDEYEAAAMVPLCKKCARKDGRALTKREQDFLFNIQPVDRRWLIENFDLTLEYCTIQDGRQMTFYGTEKLQAVLAYLKELDA